MSNVDYSKVAHLRKYFMFILALQIKLMCHERMEELMVENQEFMFGN